MYIKIRNCKEKDFDKIEMLLKDVKMLHRNLRPDIFSPKETKYTKEEIEHIINSKDKGIFVAVNDNDEVIGYTFYEILIPASDQLVHNKTLYIDDLCIDSNFRGNGIGTKLYEYTLKFAKEIDCYNLTLNVWYDNKKALEFYKKIGLTPQKIEMEKILK